MGRIELPGGATAVGAVRRSIGAVEDLRGDGRGWVLAFVSLGWFFTFGIRLVYPAMLPAFQTSLDVDLVQGGLLISLIWLAYAVSQFPGGVMADWVGERAVLVGGVLVTALGLGLVVAARGPPALFAGSALVGLGAGVYSPTRFTVLSDLYTDRDGLAHGVVAAVGNLGSAVLPVVATVLAGVLTWHAGMGFSIPLLCVVAVGLAVSVPGRTSRPMDARDEGTKASTRRVAAAITNGRTLLAAVLMLIMAFVFQSFTTIFPTYLVQTKGMSEPLAAGVLGAFLAVGIVMQVGAGAVTDRVGAASTSVLVFAATTLGLALLPLTGGLPGVLLASVLVSACSGFWPTIHAYVIPTLPSSIQGSALGVVRTGYLILAAPGPAIAGAVSATVSFAAALGMLVALGAVGIVLAYGLPELPDQ